MTREDFVRIKELCEESIEVIHRKHCVKQSYPNILSLECIRVYRPGSSQQKRISDFFWINNELLFQVLGRVDPGYPLWKAETLKVDLKS